MLNWFRMKSKNKKKFLRNYKKEKLMFGALKTVENHNLYASFGLIDNLEENELQDINGGWCVCNGFSVNITTNSNNGSENGSNNGSGNFGGSSGSSSSSSSS